MVDTHKKIGVCGVCKSLCGVELSIKDNKVIDIKGDKNNPWTRGYICPRGRALPEIMYSKDRLSTPMKKDSNGNFEEISWDTALDIIIERLKYFKENFGAETVAMFTGEGGVSRQFPAYVERFCSAYGSPNFATSGSHCHLSKTLANIMTLGALPAADYENSRCISLWGYNPANSSPPKMIYINKALRKGAKLIVVDPQETRLAKRADIHLRLRPGTDGALALGLIHVIINESLYDSEFVKNWTIGFEGLTDLVKDYTPDKVSEITCVSSELITAAARMLANNRPTNFSPGIAIELQSNGFQAARAISILQAIIGDVDVKGGGIITSPPRLSAINKKHKFNKAPIGSQEYPLFFKLTGHAQANIFSDAILENKPYSLKAMIVMASNPMLTWPNSNKLYKALESLDFLVVMDIFMTKTAELADIVLPGTLPIERYELWNGSGMFARNILGVSPKLIDSEYSMSEWKFIRELAKGMGYGEEFPWETEEEAIISRFKNFDKSYEELLDLTYGYEYEPLKEKRYEDIGFKTPSKKVEIYSQALKEMGIDPLPVYYEPVESPLATKDLGKKYPLVVSTGARYLEYYHSRYRNIKSIKEYSREKEARAKIHPETAIAQGVEDGDTVTIESLRGSIEIKIGITNGVVPGTLLIPHGWDNANANKLTDNIKLDPITGFPPDRAFLARI